MSQEKITRFRRRVDSLYWQQFLLTAGMVLLTLLLLGVSFYALSYNDTVSERRSEMRQHAELIANMSGDYLASGGQTASPSLQNLIALAAGLTKADFLLCNDQGYALLTSDQRLGGQVVSVPQEIQDAVFGDKGFYQGRSSIGGAYDIRQFVVAVPVTQEDGGTVGMVLAVMDARSLMSMWRSFIGLFFMTSAIILLISFVASSLTSMRQIQPIREMVQATRSYAAGNFDVRMQDTGRSDEIDDVCAQLAELGAGGMVVEDETDFQQFLEQNHQYWDYVDDALEAQFRGVSRIKFYLADDDDGRAQLAAIRAGIGRELTTATVRDSDWENNWRQYYQPIETGERLVVVPEWLDAPADGRLPLRLDPGLIFGTGSHATTRMCLAALEHCAGVDKTVLDLGCGSGILGIGALLLGCAHVTGCDIDPKAPEVAAANAALNGFYDDKFTVCAGDILADAGLRRRLGTGYDIVLANIVADVIIPLAALAPAFLAPGGTFVCSGIIDGREDEVAAALTRAGFTVTAHDTLEEWHCFTAVLA